MGDEAAVLGAVVAVVVAPVDFQAVAVAVGQRPAAERLEILPPLGADLDAAAAVAVKFLVLGVIAAGHDGLPESVQVRARLSVRSLLLGGDFAVAAAAGLRAALEKVLAKNRLFRAADAAGGNPPPSLPAGAGRTKEWLALDGEPAEWSADGKQPRHLR